MKKLIPLFLLIPLFTMGMGPCASTEMYLKMVDTQKELYLAMVKANQPSKTEIVLDETGRVKKFESIIATPLPPLPNFPAPPEGAGTILARGLPGMVSTLTFGGVAWKGLDVMGEIGKWGLIGAGGNINYGSGSFQGSQGNGPWLSPSNFQNPSLTVVPIP